LILDSIFFSGDTLENILENFVESELAEALSAISNESWEPALNQRVSNPELESSEVSKSSLTLAKTLRGDSAR
jgi:hypothetical protein